MWHYQIITFFILITLPFFPRQLDPKIPLAIFIFAASLLPIFIKNLIDNLRKKDLVTYFFVIFLFFACLSTIFSIDQKQSLNQLLLFCSYFVVFVSISFVFTKFKDKEKLAAVFLTVTVLLSIISNYNTLVLNYVNKEMMGVSFKWTYFGHNHLSALLLLAIPISFYFLKSYWKDKGWHTINLFIFFFLILTLYFTFARASLLSLLAAFYVAIIVYKLVPKKLAGIGVLWHIVIIGLLITGIVSNAKMFSIDKNDLASSRIVYWKVAFNNVASHPFFGTGLDTYRIANYSQAPKSQRAFYAHNFFIQNLSDGGVPGFLASLVLIISLVWKGAINVRKNLKTKPGFLYMVFWIGILASTLNSLVDFDWQLATVSLIFWIVGGILVFDIMGDNVRIKNNSRSSNN